MLNIRYSFFSSKNLLIIFKNKNLKQPATESPHPIEILTALSAQKRKYSLSHQGGRGFGRCYKSTYW